MSASDSRLWLALRFVDLPLAALSFAKKSSSAISTATSAEVDIRPIAVIEKQQVIYANASALQAGVKRGMNATKAQLLSGCEIYKRDTIKERAVLHQLTEQLYQFSPYIDCYCSTERAQSGLLLEISSCLKLFGGIENLCARIFEHLQNTSHHFAFGFAHSAQAAWYLSFKHYPITGDENKTVFINRLNTLPIELLFDYPQAMDTLAKTGFKTFGDLAVQISGKSLSSFKKRLGHEFTTVLSNIYDIDQNFQQGSLFAKPRITYQPDEWFERVITFEYPVTAVEQLKPALEMLLQELSDYLRKRQQQCQYIEWKVSDIYHNQQRINVNSDTPQSSWPLLYDLSLIQLENQELPFEIDTLRLTCRHPMPLNGGSHTLNFDQSRRKKSVQDFAVTLAKLKTRLGENAVYKLSYHDSRVPELTNIMVTPIEKSTQELPLVHCFGLRPTWLLSTPEPIEERHNRLYWRGYLSLAIGPERVIGNWWEAPVARDYYLARRHDNLTVWIFFNLYDKKWYTHGVFS